jgi:DNA-binding NarL/FixJ family response regulator
MHDDAEYVREADVAGARGYLLKSSAPELIRQAIAVVSAGGTFHDPAIAGALQQGAGCNDSESSVQPLTPREREVLTQIAQGLLNKEIADQLHLSVRTVETYRVRLMRKLEMHSVTELTRYAIANNMISI